MTTPVQEGEILAGKFQVERVLGQGGMGVVVAAKHLQLDQKVALKFLLPEALVNQGAVMRFEREARAAVKIQSEHVAKVLDVGKLDTGVPYMVMEYLKGSDLSEVLKVRGTLTVDEAVDWILQACEAMAEAHSHGIIHRDLKPKNLFVVRRPDGSSVLKVLDFGISKSVVPGASDAAVLTNTTAVMGSPLYMSPEQLRSSRDVDVRTDIWALGVILYEMLAGQPPFQAETMPQLCMSIVSDAPAPLSSRRPDLPQGLEETILKCLEKEPANRYNNVAQLARALGEFASSRGRMSVERISRILQNVEMSDTIPVSERSPAMPGAPTGSTSTAWADSKIKKIGLAMPSQPSVLTGSTAGSAGSSRVVKAIAVAAIALGTLMVGGFFFLNNQKPTQAAVQPLPQPPPAIIQQEPAEVKKVKIKITTTPPEAVIFLDNARLGSGTATAEMKADSTDHPLRVEARGFKTDSRFIKLDKDIELEIKLEEEPRKVVGGPRVPPPPPTTKRSSKGGLGIDTTSPY
ncbi:MAG: serine/threonine-protein kinase [Myxococcales bacterium]|nr:protein kinase [Polyangiaceae bacterium]MDW8251512.1 serine/threonine-protein kinase [Myxococcales bacterium]